VKCKLQTLGDAGIMLLIKGKLTIGKVNITQKLFFEIMQKICEITVLQNKAKKMW